MGQRLNATERRRSILDVATGLFAERGFNGISIDAIASAAGVSPAIIYRHFASKQALYDAVMQALSTSCDAVIDELPEDAELDALVSAMTRACIASVLSSPESLRMDLQCQLDGRASESPLATSWAELDERLMRLLSPLTHREDSLYSARLMYRGMLRELLNAHLLHAAGGIDEAHAFALGDEMSRLFLRAIGINKPQLSRRAVINR